MHDTKIIYSEDQINKKVQELASKIAVDYKGKKIMMIGILKGSFIFFSDLIRALYKNGVTDVVVDFITVSSYGTSTTYSGKSRILADITRDIKDQEVLVIEDIVDTGHTLVFVKQYLLAKKPASLKFAVFLDKVKRREVEFVPEYVGFVLEGTPWIEGYGLDGGEYGRGRPEVAEKIQK